jgi:hypothetical protein
VLEQQQRVGDGVCPARSLELVLQLEAVGVLDAAEAVPGDGGHHGLL